jgi:hypothetical protein
MLLLASSPAAAAAAASAAASADVVGAVGFWGAQEGRVCAAVRMVRVAAETCEGLRKYNILMCWVATEGQSNATLVMFGSDWVSCWCS